LMARAIARVNNEDITCINHKIEENRFKGNYGVKNKRE
jgi:hypothetical protein